MGYVISKNRQINTGKYWLIIFLMGAVTAVSIFIAAYQGRKWLLAISMAIIGLYMAFALSKNVKHLILVIAVFLIPLRLDFYIIFKKTYYIQTGYSGLPITAFDIIFVVLFFHFVFQVIRGDEKIKFYPALSVPAIFYILLTGISAFYSHDRTLSFSNFFLIIKLYFVFLYFANRIKTKSDLSLVAMALVFAVGLQIVVGSLQYLTDGAFLKGVFGVPTTSFREGAAGSFVLSRVGGTIGHPNALARYLCFSTIILIGYAFARIQKQISLLSLITALLGGVILLLTMSRGSWLALSLTLFFVLYHVFRHFIGSRSKAFVAVILLNFFLFFFIFVVFENVRIRLLEDDYGTARARIPMAQVALNIIKEHPLTGIGLNNYTHVMQNYDHTREWQTYKFPHPVHNSYLLIAAESGIPALVSFLWLIVALLAKTRLAFQQIDNPIAVFQIGCIGGVLTWMISALFDRDLAGLNEMLWFTMALAIALNRMIENTDETEREK